MKVTVSDVMLDLATGDASQYDAFVQEAVGQVRVSAAYFNAGMNIASLSDSERTEIVQESAFVDSGLPSDRAGAIELVYESVEHELNGTCRHLYMEAAKITERAEKATSPYGAIDALGKASGMTRSFDGSLEYITEYAQKVSKGKDTEVQEGRFLKAKAAANYTKSVINAFTLVCDAFCIDTSSVMTDEVVNTVMKGSKVESKCNKKDGKDECTLGHIESSIKAANKMLDKVSVKESDYTKKITSDDRAVVLACDTALTKVAKLVKSKLGGEEGGAKAEKLIKKAVGSCSKKAVDGSAADLNEKNENGAAMIQEFNKKLLDAVKELTTAFNDSISTDVSAKAGKDE